MSIVTSFQHSTTRQKKFQKQDHRDCEKHLTIIREVHAYRAIFDSGQFHLGQAMFDLANFWILVQKIKLAPTHVSIRSHLSTWANCGPLIQICCVVVVWCCACVCVVCVCVFCFCVGTARLTVVYSGFRLFMSGWTALPSTALVNFDLFFSLWGSSRGIVAPGRSHGPPNLNDWAPWGHRVKPWQPVGGWPWLESRPQFHGEGPQR